MGGEPSRARFTFAALLALCSVLAALRAIVRQLTLLVDARLADVLVQHALGNATVRKPSAADVVTEEAEGEAAE